MAKPALLPICEREHLNDVGVMAIHAQITWFAVPGKGPQSMDINNVNGSILICGTCGRIIRPCAHCTPESPVIDHG